MGRPLPLQLYDAKKAKPSKAVHKARKDAELRIGDDNYQMPPELYGDVDAMSEWDRITKLYKKAGLRITSNSDTNILSRYCITNSEYLDLKKQQPEIPTKIAQTTYSPQGNEQIKETEEFLEWKQRDTIIMKKMDILMKLEDRLFLSPLAKFKYIPMIVKKDKKKEELDMLGFGNL